MQIQNRTPILRGPRGLGAACAFFVLAAVLCAVVANVSLAGAAVAASGACGADAGAVEVAGADAAAQGDAAASALAAGGAGAVAGIGAVAGAVAGGAGAGADVDAGAAADIEAPGAEVVRLQLEAVADAAFADGQDDASDTFGMVANFGVNNCQNGRWEAHFSVLESSVGALGARGLGGAGGASADGGSVASWGLGLGASTTAVTCTSAGGVLALDESAGATGAGQGAFVCYLVNTSGAGVAYSVTLTSSVGAGVGAAAGGAGSVPVEVNLLVGEAARAYIDGAGAEAGGAAVGGAAAGDAAASNAPKSAADLQQCLAAGGVELPCGIAALVGTGAVVEGQLGVSSDANEVPVVVTWSLTSVSENNAATLGTFDDVAVSLSLCVQGAPAALSDATDGNSPSVDAPAGVAPGTSAASDAQPSGDSDNTEIHDAEGVTGNINLTTSDAPNDSAHQVTGADVDDGADDGADDGSNSNVSETAPEQADAALASTGDAAVKTVAALCALAVTCVAAVCYVLLKA